MKDIILIGSGNVATHLGINLKDNNFNIVQVISSTLKNAETLATKLIVWKAVQDKADLEIHSGMLNPYANPGASVFGYGS